jgi:hypothetical protein
MRTTTGPAATESRNLAVVAELDADPYFKGWRYGRQASTMTLCAAGGREGPHREDARKDKEPREREAAWAAEDAALNATASRGASVEEVLRQAEAAWEAGRAFFVFESILGMVHAAPLGVTIDQAQTNAPLATLLRRWAGVSIR